MRLEANVDWGGRLGRPQSVANDRGEVFRGMEGPDTTMTETNDLFTEARSNQLTVWRKPSHSFIM